MTSFRIERLPFSRASIDVLSGIDHRFVNWPVVYAIDDARRIYIGESINVVQRMRQHLETPSKSRLRQLRVVLDDEFKVCRPRS
jgi:hypothetical protein